MTTEENIKIREYKKTAKRTESKKKTHEKMKYIPEI